MTPPPAQKKTQLMKQLKSSTSPHHHITFHITGKTAPPRYLHYSTEDKQLAIGCRVRSIWRASEAVARASGSGCKQGLFQAYTNRRTQHTVPEKKMGLRNCQIFKLKNLTYNIKLKN